MQPDGGMTQEMAGNSFGRQAALSSPFRRRTHLRLLAVERRILSGLVVELVA